MIRDQGSTGGGLYLIPSTGGEPKDVTPGRAASVAFIGWVSPQVIGIAEHVAGSSHITALNLGTGKDLPQVNVTFPETVGAGGMSMSVSPSHAHTITLIRSSFEKAPEVW